MENIQNKSLKMALLTLFFVLFIDSIGAGLVIPLLTPLFLNHTSDFLPATASLNSHNILYGITLGVFAICMFIGAPIIGNLSDRVGRKPVLLLCLAGTFIGYLMSAIAIDFHSISLFLFGRVIDGITAGSLPVAQAAIVDISGENNRIKNMGLILLAISLGFIAGPLLGGVLSDHSLYTRFGSSIPLYVTAAISIINFVFLVIYFKETFVIDRSKKMRIFSVFTSIRFALQKNILTLSFIFFTMQFGWAIYFQFFGMYLHDLLNFSSTQIGLFLTFVGLGLGMSFGYLVGKLSAKFSLKVLLIGSLLLMFATFCILLYSNCLIVLFVLATFSAITYGISYTSIIGLLSNTVDKNSQGMIMGIAGAICALCAGVSAIVAGYLVNFGAFIPMILAITCIFISLIFSIKMKFLCSN